MAGLPEAASQLLKNSVFSAQETAEIRFRPGGPHGANAAWFECRMVRMPYGSNIAALRKVIVRDRAHLWNVKCQIDAKGHKRSHESGLRIAMTGRTMTEPAPGSLTLNGRRRCDGGSQR